MATARHTDHIVDLNLTTRAHAQTTRNTSIQVNRHRDVTVIQQRNVTLFQFWKTAL